MYMSDMSQFSYVKREIMLKNKGIFVHRLPIFDHYIFAITEKY